MPNITASFEELGREFVFQPNHKIFNAEEAQRFVDSPLAVKGLEKEATRKVMEHIRKLNERSQEKSNLPFSIL